MKERNRMVVHIIKRVLKNRGDACNGQLSAT